MKNPNKPPHLDRAPLSYQNPAFVNSPDGRLVRILSEYSEPLARFRRERIQDTIVFFGSARFRELEHANRQLELLDKPWLATCQLAPWLISVTVSFAEVSVHEPAASMVCAAVVAMVSTGVGPVVLAFFIM